MATTNGHRRPITDQVQEQLRWSREEARTLGAQVGDIAADLRDLAALEARLARAEMKEQLALSARNIALGAGALLFSLLALTFAFLTVMFALWVALPMWAAALITTLILLGIAGTAGFLAYDGLRQVKVKPERTLQSIREDMAWARDQMRSSAR